MNPTRPSNVWIGTSGFQYPEWKGSFYPEKLAATKMLPFYAERLSTTESNYTFRSIPSPTTMTKWFSLTPEQFRFSFKAPQKVTHFARLRDCGETMAYFHTVVLGLSAKLGAVLIQLPPNFKKDAPLLLSFLESLPQAMRVAFEFRHDSWFDDEIFAHLRTHSAALCIAESEDLKTPRVATADFGCLRLRREDYSEADLARWADFLRAQERQWQEAFVYFKHEETGSGPRFAQSLMGMLA
ncbi:MAG: hypothetical protein QOE70_5107 [Chthoniobacter sp.]|nr:hypothetical protein [Chthoniobacter sp.]